MIKLKDLLTEIEGKLNESLFVALVLKRKRKDSGFEKDISQFKRRGIQSGILQSNADRIFKSEVSRNVDKEAGVNLKNIKQYGQAGLKGSKNPSGRKRQFIDAISGEIKNADKKNNYHIKDGHTISATKNLDLVFSTSNRGLESLLKKKYKVTK